MKKNRLLTKEITISDMVEGFHLHKKQATSYKTLKISN
jgi:hypothetical protein